MTEKRLHSDFLSLRKAVKFTPLVLMFLLDACSKYIDAYPILKEQCESGLATNVDGTYVAETEFILLEGQEVKVGGGFQSANIVRSKGSGDMTIKPASPDSYPLLILDDGRSIVYNIGSTVFDLESDQKLAISHWKDGTRTGIQVTMNCDDPNKIPPAVRAKNGFSPCQTASKPSPFAYRGFGR